MKFALAAAVAVSAGLLASCAPGAGTVTQSGYAAPSPTRATRQTVNVENSEFEQRATFVGIEQIYGSGLPPELPDKYFIRSWVDKRTGATEHQIYVMNSYVGDWRFWNLASNDRAQPLRLVSIDRTVIFCGGYGGCSHSETVGIMLSDADLRAARATGYRMQLRSRTGLTQVIQVTPAQIQAQMDAIDAFRRSNVRGGVRPPAGTTPRNTPRTAT